MGYAVDIFTSQPPACYICAVCHDVLKSAVMFKCGHSFCEECAKACLPSKSCPNCRVEVTTFFPILIVRESIGSLEVQCPNGGDESNKKARGNDGEAVRVSTDVCTWKGKCEDLQNHEKVCDFKMIRCSIDGCNHECRRKDMNSHLSGGNGFLLHMNLMKQSITASYESKMKVMEQSIQQSNLKEVEKMKKSYDKKMEAMKASYKTKITAIKESYDDKMKDMEQSTTKQISELKDEIKSMQRKVPGVLPPFRPRPQTTMGLRQLERAWKNDKLEEEVKLDGQRESASISSLTDSLGLRPQTKMNIFRRRNRSSLPTSALMRDELNDELNALID